MTDTAATEAARALAARRPRVMYICDVCSQPFEARAQGGKRAVRVCKMPRCQNKRREQTRKPKS